MTSTPIWRHPVNWSSPWEEEVSFATEIITSRDGSEQRIAQRVSPRISHRWKSWARGRDLAAVDSRFARDQGAEIAFIHPFAPSDEFFRLNGNGDAGDTFITVPASGKPSWFAVGRTVVLIAASGLAEIVTLTSNALGTFYDIAEPLTNSFPAATTYVHEALFGRIEGESALGAVTDGTGGFDMDVALSPGLNVARSFGSAATTYDGRELFDLSPNWSGGIPMRFDQVFDAHDFGRGPISRTFFQDFTARTFTLRYLVRDETTRDAILGNFYRARGRQKAFYAPLWVSTLVPNAIASGVNVSFTGPDVYRAFHDQQMYRHVRIRRRSGADLLREVTGITLDGGNNSIMVLASSVPAVPLDDLIGMHWLLRVRHESDRLAMDWITHDVAEVSMALRALKESDE